VTKCLSLLNEFTNLSFKHISVLMYHGQVEYNVLISFNTKFIITGKVLILFLFSDENLGKVYKAQKQCWKRGGCKQLIEHKHGPAFHKL
jgi:hypothetical protein